MRIDLHVHSGGQDEINQKLDRILEVQHSQGVKMSKALDDLNAEVEELKVSAKAHEDALAACRAEVAELKVLLEGLKDGASAAELDAVREQVNAVEDALEVDANPPPPAP